MSLIKLSHVFYRIIRLVFLKLILNILFIGSDSTLIIFRSSCQHKCNTRKFKTLVNFRLNLTACNASYKAKNKYKKN